MLRLRVTADDYAGIGALAHRLGVKTVAAARHALRDGLVGAVELDAEVRAILADLAALDGLPASVVLAQLIRDAARRRIAGSE